MKRAKRLIINADELGLTRGINKGIIEAYEQGVVTSASIMYGGYDLDYAVDFCRASGFDVGVHLNLTYGEGLRGKANTLTDGNGSFFVRRQLLFRAAKGLLDYREVYNELEAQILFFLNKGLKLTHLDTHQHIHMAPIIFEAVRDLAQKYDLFMRLPQETVIVQAITQFRDIKVLIKKKMIVWRCRRLREQLKDDVRVLDKFLSPFGFIPRLRDFSVRVFEQLMRRAVVGTNEYMAHPGYIDAAFNNFSEWKEQREQELRVYKSTEAKDILERYEIKLCNFRNLEQRRR